MAKGTCDAAAYARPEGITEAEALRRLTVQQASVAATDALDQRFRRHQWCT